MAGMLSAAPFPWPCVMVLMCLVDAHRNDSAKVTMKIQIKTGLVKQHSERNY